MLDRSPEFAEHWARHDARGKGAEHKRLVHPDVGALDLHLQSFDVRSAPGQQLVVYGCKPGSETADRLELLGIAAASRA